MDFIIASGIKQKNIQDQLDLEDFLQLDKIVPMQTSYTQTAEDRDAKDETSEKQPDKDSKEKKSEIEPSDDKEVGESEEGNNPEEEK